MRGGNGREKSHCVFVERLSDYYIIISERRDRRMENFKRFPKVKITIKPLQSVQ